MSLRALRSDPGDSRRFGGQVAISVVLVVLAFLVLLLLSFLIGREIEASSFVTAIRPVIRRGDTVPGMGQVTSVGRVAVNNSGDWVVEVDTDHGDLSRDQALVRNGVVLVREGDALAAPANASVATFLALDLNDQGNVGLGLSFLGTPAPNDEGVFFNTNLLLQKGAVSGAPGLTPGTPYTSFCAIALNESNQAVIAAVVDDPALGGNVPVIDQVLLLGTLDGAGNLIVESDFVKEGDLLAGQTETVEDLEFGPHDFAINDRGNLLYVVNLNGDSTRDHVVYMDNTIIAQEGTPSPVPGRNWFNLGFARVDTNAGGGHVYTGRLAGSAASDLVIVTNGASLVQEGDPAPGGFTFQRFGGSSPLKLNDLGQTLWFGDWNEPDLSRDTGLFLDHCLLVQEGVTLIEGRPLVILEAGREAYDMSDSGRWILFTGTVQGRGEGAYLLEIGTPPLVLASPAPGTTQVNNTLTATGATSGSMSFLAVGLLEGSLPIPPCPGQVLGIGDPQLVGRATADATGRVDFNLFVPRAAQGLRILFQIVEPSSCRLSNRVGFTFP